LNYYSFASSATSFLLRPLGNDFRFLVASAVDLVAAVNSVAAINIISDFLSYFRFHTLSLECICEVSERLTWLGFFGLFWRDKRIMMPLVRRDE